MAVPRIYYGPGGSYPDPNKKKTNAEMLASATTPQVTPIAKLPDTTPGGGQGPTTTTTDGTTRTITPWGYSPEVTDVYGKLKEGTYTAPFTSQEIMQMPEYQALADVSKFNTAQAQAGLDRSFASRNLLRSTPMVQAAGSNAAYFTARMNEQLPALINAAYARRQQDLANQQALLGESRGLEDVAFSRGAADLAAGRGILESERAFGVTEAGLTGQYQPQNVAALLQAVVNAKKSWATESDGTTKAQDEAAANAARQALAGLGFPPERVESLVGAGVPLEQAQANIGRFTMPTLQGRAAEQGLAAGDVQSKLQQLELQKAELQAQIDADPSSGLAAEARKRMEKLDADIASTRSLASQRQEGGGLTPYQQYQVDVGLMEREQKADQGKIDQYTKNYDITPMGAESWMALQDALNQAKAQGMTWEQSYSNFIQPLFQALPAMTAKDRQFITSYASAMYGNTNAANVLETLRKGYKPPEE